MWWIAEGIMLGVFVSASVIVIVGVMDFLQRRSIRRALRQCDICTAAVGTDGRTRWNRDPSGEWQGVECCASCFQRLEMQETME